MGEQGPGGPIGDQPERDAASAAERAGVAVQEITEPAGVAPVAEVCDRVWAIAEGESLLPQEILRMFALTGQYLAVARDAGSGELLGASLGLFSHPAGRALHSHVTAALPQASGRSVGLALKLHQRAWALRRGLAEITWTFDPLVRRNAWFNLTKLAARPERYLTEVYGVMSDEINAGDASDRLYLRWTLTDPAVVAACAGRPRTTAADELRDKGFPVLVSAGDDAPGPRVTGQPPGPDGALVQVPASIESLRRRDPAAAGAWRAAVREALSGAMTAGMVITAITRDGWYVLQPAGPGSRP
jgi:predicted GNAT superfamily acetyltransferase